MDKLLQSVKEFAFAQTKETGAPSLFNLNLSNKKGQWLAEKLGANKGIVLAGTLLMDCQLGQAMKLGKIAEHIEMSAKKADELLTEFPDIDNETKEKIVYCVRQHHGTEKFHSLEAEICCNADCYRFASLRGFVDGLRSFENMSTDGVLKLLDSKADEKWHSLSLDICKKELKQQYQLIKSFIKQYYV
ncbi:MAG TPA: hypothetical protein VMW25_05745 [Clostridia bacterium]|nr:hypothetical protein [Clostridia bacterium]